ncbi:glutathione binding-like protein [Rhodobacteraceae bacterium]|nr:glutathione binding-like protein [Paracoccaceae bacterium]
MGHRFGGTDTAEFTAMNPNQTVPVIKDGNAQTLWESGAILRYLAGQYGDDPFWPRDLQARANVDRWAEWSKLNIAIVFTGPVLWQVVRTPKEQQEQTRIKQAVAQLEHLLSIANAQLENRAYLAGDEFSLADIQFRHVLYRYYTIPIARRPLPAVAQYYSRLAQRAAYKAHVMVSFDKLQA